MASLYLILREEKCKTLMLLDFKKIYWIYISLNKNFVKNSTKLLIILNVPGCYRRSRSALTLFPAPRRTAVWFDIFSRKFMKAHEKYLNLAVRFAVIGKIQSILLNGTDKTPSLKEIYNVVKVLPIIISRWCNRSWKIWKIARKIFTSSHFNSRMIRQT